MAQRLPGKWTQHDRFLGMDRRITRRDFLEGVATVVTGSLIGTAPSASAAPSEVDPSERGGLRGQDPESMRLGHAVRIKRFDPAGQNIADTGESYDLVVIGAGMAGLAAAYVYHREKKGRCRILILDNHHDFGGHARRNTFRYKDAMLIAHGGNFELEAYDESPRSVKEIFREVGINPERLAEFRDERAYDRLGLTTGVFFDPQIYPGIKPTWVNGYHDIPYDQFFAKAPVQDKVRAELIELHTTRKNYLPDVRQMEKALAEMSWETFIRRHMKLGGEAVQFANLYAADLLGLGSDAVSALAAREVGPGFAGMGGKAFSRPDGRPCHDNNWNPRYPDGSYTMARHFVRAILPEALPDGGTPEELFNGRVRYSALDLDGRSVRIRLKSMAMRVEHEGGLTGSRGIVVHYRQPDGRLFRVRADHAVMAGWGAVAKRIVPELPASQLAALQEFRCSAVLYINVLLRQWRPVANLKLSEMWLPGGYCQNMFISDPLRIGNYKPEYRPDRPTILTLHKNLCTPGIDPKEQMTGTRATMETTPFVAYEREVREELNRLFGPWGLKAADDIEAITINRWAHGYTFCSLPGERKTSRKQGRAMLGRISFAGADMGGEPWTQSAIQEGRRTALEQL